MAEVKTIFDCFFIAKAPAAVAENPTQNFIYPEDYEDPSLKQLLMFCFPFDSTNSISSSIVQRNQHFTFMLTDLEKRHRYGFCKLVEGSKSCYCFISNLPWFEVFYKLLNCMYELNIKHDLKSMNDLLQRLYETLMPKPLQVIQISTSLTFTAPLETARPSIPENRNLMEYLSACNTKVMMEVFAALMHERRVIITSSSLSILAGCVFSAETLLHPLNWQHIYIPILPPHVLDYCTAPIPYLIGIHSSLMSSVRRKIHGDEFGIVIVNVDEKKVESPFHDLERIPNDVSSYLKTQLNKPNVAVGTHLATAFLKTQARLIGSYRNALKIHNGKSIVFDEDLFIESQYLKQKKIFAEEMINLQTFKEFIDKRVELLNSGVGFRDDFEAEVNRLQEVEGTTQSKVYKDWMQVKEKGGELITTMRKHAKENYKVARQSMIEVTSKSTESTPNRTTSITKRQSLRENLRSMRPPRPAPPKPRRPAPPRPPPRSGSVRKYKVIDFEEDEDVEDGANFEEEVKEEEGSLQDVSIDEEEQPSNLLIDFSDFSEEVELTSHNQNVSNEMDLLSLIDADLPAEYSPTLEPTLLQPTQVATRAAYQISKDKILSPNGEIDPADLFGFSWSHENAAQSTQQTQSEKTTATGSDWFSFDNFASNGGNKSFNQQPISQQQTVTSTSSSDTKDDILLNFGGEEPTNSLPPPLLPGL